MNGAGGGEEEAVDWVRGGHCEVRVLGRSQMLFCVRDISSVRSSIAQLRRGDASSCGLSLS